MNNTNYYNQLLHCLFSFIFTLDKSVSMILQFENVGTGTRGWRSGKGAEILSASTAATSSCETLSLGLVVVAVTLN